MYEFLENPIEQNLESDIVTNINIETEQVIENSEIENTENQNFDILQLIEKPEIDLFSFYTVLSKLESDLKISLKTQKKAADTADTKYSELSELYKNLNSSFNAFIQEDKIKGIIESVKPIIQTIDKIQNIKKISHSLKPKNFFARLFLKKNNISALIESLEFLERFEISVLTQKNISQIQALNQIFNPETMKAVEIQKDSGVQDNCVIEEYLKGYMYQNKIIRFAEVKVNKI